MIWIKWPGRKKNRGYPEQFNNYMDNYYNTSFYPQGYNKRGKNPWRRAGARVAIALLILGMLLVVREVEVPGSRQLKSSVQYLLTAEWNFQPLWQDAVRVAGQITNWDNPAFHQWPSTEPAAPVSGQDQDIWVPMSGKVVREFGWTESNLDGLEKYHPGVDIKAEAGTPVYAAMEGTVAGTGSDEHLGDYILLQHGDGVYTLYAGIRNIIPGEGQLVSRGQQIAEAGKNGDIPEGGLHFELRENGKPVDPLGRMHSAR